MGGAVEACLPAIRGDLAEASHARLAECWGPESEPEGFLVDKAGVVRAFHPGYHDGEAELIEQEAEALLAEPPAYVSTGAILVKPK